MPSRWATTGTRASGLHARGGTRRAASIASRTSALPSKPGEELADGGAVAAGHELDRVGCGRPAAARPRTCCIAAADRASRMPEGVEAAARRIADVAGSSGRRAGVGGDVREAALVNRRARRQSGRARRARSGQAVRHASRRRPARPTGSKRRAAISCELPAAATAATRRGQSRAGRDGPRSGQRRRASRPRSAAGWRRGCPAAPRLPAPRRSRAARALVGARCRSRARGCRAAAGAPADARRISAGDDRRRFHCAPGDLAGGAVAGQRCGAHSASAPIVSRRRSARSSRWIISARPG